MDTTKAKLLEKPEIEKYEKKKKCLDCSPIMTPLVITVKNIFIFHAFNCNPEYMTTHHPQQTVGYLQMDVFAQLETSYLLFHTAQNDWLLVLTVLVRHVIVKLMRVYVFRVMDMVFSVMIITIYQVLIHIFYKLYPLLLLTDV